MQIRLKSSRARKAKQYPPKKTVKQTVIKKGHTISTLEYHLMRKDMEEEAGREWDGHKY